MDSSRALAALRVAIRLAIMAAVVVAIVVVEASSRSGVTWRLITFTYQANLAAAVFYAATLCSRRIDARAGLRGAVVVYVLVAGLVWNLFLTGVSMGYTPANFLLHVAVPALAAGEWLLARRRQSVVRWWHPWLWLAYPACYAVAALVVLNRAGRRAPYYFLDPASVGIGAVGVNIGALAGVFLVLGYLLLAVDRASPRVQERRP